MTAEATYSSRGARRGAATGAREVIAFVHPKPLGTGGLGRLAEDALRSLLASGAEVHAFGPSTASAVRETLQGAVWHEAPPPLPSWVHRRTWMRWWLGQYILLESWRLGRWAAREVARLGPDRCYAFSEVARETLEWSRVHGVPTVLDNPTGDVRHFRDANVREARRWLGGPFRGHPNPGMVARSVAEYELADAIRVASTFSRDSMVERGVPAGKVAVVRYPLDVRRFVPPAAPRDAAGPLRVVYVAGIGLAKGFQYLLEAARLAGPQQVALELVGGTDSRGSVRLLARRREGIALRHGPVGNLLEAYHRAELFVLPSLHDGWGFVVAEAMACGLPAVVTETAGARDLVEPGRTGWIVPAGDASAMAAVLREALADRQRLARMGAAARDAVSARGREWDHALERWWAREAPTRAAR